MAKQIGYVKITGTIDDICFYIREGEYLARQKSSLTRKRFFSDPAFEGSRLSCSQMTRASKLASALYAAINKEKKSRELFREVTGRIKILIGQGKVLPDIISWFERTYLNQDLPASKSKAKQATKKSITCYNPIIKYNSVRVLHKKPLHRRNKYNLANNKPYLCRIDSG